jgi:hypothetical protein
VAGAVVYRQHRPKSRRRPAAARKLAASRRNCQGGAGAREDDAYKFIEAPWVTWQQVNADPAAVPRMLTVLEHTPFRLAGAEGTEGSLTTLAEMSGEFTGGMAEFVSSQQQLADWDTCTGNSQSNSAALCIPADAADSLAER